MGAPLDIEKAVRTESARSALLRCVGSV